MTDPSPGSADREALAERMATLLGLPLANVKLLMPLVPEEAIERLAGLPDDQFLMESTKVISAAQQRQFEGIDPATLKKQSGRPRRATRTVAEESRSDVGAGSAPRASAPVRPVEHPAEIPQMASLDRTRKRSGANLKPSGRRTLAMAGLAAVVMLLAGLGSVLVYQLLMEHPQEADLGRGMIGPTTPPEIVRPTPTKPTPEPVHPQPTAPREVPQELEFPSQLLGEIEREYGREFRDQVLAEWHQKSRAAKIAYLVEIGVWQGKVPPAAQELLRHKNGGSEPPAHVPQPGKNTATHEAEPDPAAGKLLAAAQSRDAEALRRLLTEHPERVNERDSHGQTALHLVARAGEADLVTLLLAHNAGVNVTDSNGRTPLHCLCMSPDAGAALAQALVARGAAVDAKDNLKGTPLLTAATFGNVALTEFLLANGASVKHADLYGARALHRAASVDVAKILMEHGAEITATTNLGLTPLHVAASRGRTALVDYLAGQGAEVNARDRKGATPLYHAAKGGHAETISVLLKRGADPQIRTLEGQLPLDVARDQNHDKVVAMLQGGAGE